MVLRKDGYLQPFLLQMLGIGMIVVFVALWALTGKESSLLVGAALILIGMGSASGAIISVRQEIKRGPPQDRIEGEEGENGYSKPPYPS